MKNEAVQYIKCPRCELNYISKKDKFCDVCKSEMKAGILEETDFDEFEEGMEICPICKVNYLNEGEKMCVTCQEEQLTPMKDDEPNWRGYVDQTDESDEDLDLLPVEEDEIDEELEGAFAEDLENEFEEEDEEFDGEEMEDLDDDFDNIDTGYDDDDDDEDEDNSDDDDEDDDY